jgi:uncharacterized protein
MLEHLFIAGGSVRAAAQSAVRAGFRVTAADLFCDRDLAACCDALRVPDFPAGILPLADQLAPTQWLYTGGLENEPTLVDAVSVRHRLLGQSGSVLRRIRDPWQLSAVLARAGLQFPPPARKPPRGATGQWLVKPLRGCGGTRIRLCEQSRSSEWPAPPDTPMRDEGKRRREDETFCQPWIRGPSYGAVFLAAGGTAALLGVTRQLVGCSWAGASGFRYVGSIGPVVFDAQTCGVLQRIGDCLAAAFPLCGLFGVDAIITGADVWTIEVNPRYTASVEVLERATGLAAMRHHWEVCHGAPLPAKLPCTVDLLHGKSVVYAQADHTISAEFYRRLEAARSSTAAGGECADLPQIGAKIRAGQPILTTLVQGHAVGEVHRRLRALARKVRACLAGP